MLDLTRSIPGGFVWSLIVALVGTWWTPGELIGAITSVIFLKKFSCGLEGDSRVVLMSTLRYGLGFSDSINQIYFSRFVAEAFTTQVDYNNDGFTSAEEAFNYSHDKFYPYAYEMLLSPLFQIFSLINTGFLILAFPTLYDTYPGDLPIIYHEEL